MRLLLILILGFSFSGLSQAEAWRTDTALLPKYCQDRAQGHTTGPFTKWRSKFGDVYIHVHHYCSGIYSENKAKVIYQEPERRGWLNSVEGEMLYVSRNCGPDCILYPGLHRRWGWSLAERKQYSEAIKHYELAIQVKKSYTKAYAELSDIYVKINLPQKARETLEKGLAVRPKSRKLKRRLKKLDSPDS